MTTTRAPEELELSLPYEIATLRPVSTTTRAERMQILEKAVFNTELIPQHAVYIDLKTDSGVGSRSTDQVREELDIPPLEAAPELAPEAHKGLQRLSKRFQELFGLPFMLTCNQGRAAERIWCKMHVKNEHIVPGNILFPSMRYHIASNGGQVVELQCTEANQLTSDHPFKGNMDTEGLANLIKEAGADKIPFVCIELCNNACGGHPVSLEHLKHVKQLLEPHGIPLLQRAGSFEEISWNRFATNVRELLLGLDASGLARGDVTAIIAENRMEWLCVDLATLAGGFPNVTLSPALSENMLLRLLKHSSAHAAFVEDDLGAKRLLRHRNELPDLHEIFIMGTVTSATDPVVQTLDQVRERGQAARPEHLAELLNRVQGNDLATIMYTSGSTGEPKGVMRTQENILANIASGGPIVLSKPEEMAVLVLSLNHLFGRFGFHNSVATGRTTALVEATEKAIDIETIRALAPTTMSLVPRVIEKIFEKILEHNDNRSHWTHIDTEWEARGAAAFLNTSPKTKTHRDSLAQSARESLGGHLKYVSYGGAPVHPHVTRFFQAVRIPLIGSYGSTECGGVTVSGLDENDPTNLGKPFANVEIRVAEDSELLVRGPTVSPGYFENPEATQEAFEADGWYHTGDLGRIEENGSLRLVGRKKDVFNCADGTNIYPQQLEILLESDSFIREAVLVGDRKPFLGALLVPDMQRIALETNSPNETLAHGDTLKLLQARIDSLNENLEDFEKIRGIVPLTKSFPPSVRSITVFQKVKIDRNAVAKTYAAQIENLYGQTS